jgi:hypothetical protein
MLLLLLVRDPLLIDRAAGVLRDDDFRSAAHREIFGALAAAEPGADGALGPVGGLSADATRRLDELRADRTEVTDAAQSFVDAVADIKVRGLFLQLDALDARMARAAAEEKGLLMRERQEIHRQLREVDAAAELGFKTSRRYRAYGRAPGRKAPPTEAE